MKTHSETKFRSFAVSRAPDEASTPERMVVGMENLSAGTLTYLGIASYSCPHIPTENINDELDCNRVGGSRGVRCSSAGPIDNPLEIVLGRAGGKLEGTALNS